MRALLCLCALLLTPALASGQSNSLRLSGLGVTGDSGLVPDVNGFKQIAGDVGQAMGPKMFGPADTTGSLGFNLGVDFSFTNVDEESDAWQRVNSGQGTLNSIQLQVRKGIAYSIQFEGLLTHLLDSGLWGVGMGIKYAFIEGRESAPDISLAIRVSTVLGSRDMSMLITSAELNISKSFGLGGVLSLAPYAGYSGQYTRASSYVIGVFPDDVPQPTRFVIPGQNIYRSRVFLGFRLVGAHAFFGFEALLDIPHDSSRAAIQSFTLRTGVDF